MRRARATVVVVAALSPACGALLGLDEPVLVPDELPASSEDASSPDAPLPEVIAVDASDGGTTCTPPCPPEGVAKLPGAVIALARTSTGLVAAQAGAPSRIVRFAIDANGIGGTPEDLDPACGSVADCPSGLTVIAAHPSGIFWSTPNGLRGWRPDGGVGNVGAQVTINGVAIQAQRLWWVRGDPSTSQLFSCGLPDCVDPTTSTLSTPPAAWVRDIRPVQNAVFLSFAGGAASEASIRTTTSALLYKSEQHFGRLTAAADAVVFRMGATVQRVLQNGTGEAIYEAADGVGMRAVATDPPFVYFARARTIERCSLDALPCKQPVLVAESPGTAVVGFDVMLVDSMHVYWGTNTGEIFRVAKPPP